MNTGPADDAVPCPCGKLSFPSWEAAEAVVRGALVARVLHGNTRRAEQRSYECDLYPGNWHVTSQSTSGPLVLDYADHDDTAARAVINRELQAPNDENWLLLLAPDRAEQTLRVLSHIEITLSAQRSARKEAVAAAARRRGEGQADRWDEYRAKQEYHNWRKRSDLFRAEVTHRLEQARQAVKDADRQKRAAIGAAKREQELQASLQHAAMRDQKLAASFERQRQESQEHRTAVQRLATAIWSHRGATTDPSPADLELWAALEAVTVPYRKGAVSVGELIANGSWQPSPAD